MTAFRNPARGRIPDVMRVSTNTPERNQQKGRSTIGWQKRDSSPGPVMPRRP